MDRSPSTQQKERYQEAHSGSSFVRTRMGLRIRSTLARNGEILHNTAPGPSCTTVIRSATLPGRRNTICSSLSQRGTGQQGREPLPHHRDGKPEITSPRSEEHTSELQSRQYLVCRL